MKIAKNLCVMIVHIQTDVAIKKVTMMMCGGMIMKKIILVCMLVVMVVVLASCSVGNRQVGMDTIQTFDRYKIVIGDEVIEGTIKAWRDFDDSDVVQIMDYNGTVYLTHYRNALIVRDPR